MILFKLLILVGILVAGVDVLFFGADEFIFTTFTVNEKFFLVLILALAFVNLLTAIKELKEADYP